LARSEADGCNYCLAAHSYIARKLAKVDENESAIDREGRLVGSKRQAAIMFAKPLIETAHKVSDEEFGAALKAGWSDANSIDIIVDDAVAADQLSQQRGADADRLSGRPDHQAEDSLISFLPAASLTVGRPRFRTQSPVLRGVMKRQIIRVEPHANINSHRKRREDQVPRLREEPGDGD